MPTPGTIPQWQYRLVTAIRITIAVVLGGIGASAGFIHTHEWAVHNGQLGWLAWADAVVIEGMAVVAGFEVYRDAHRGITKRLTFPMAVLVVSFTIQMAAQVALAPRTVAGWLLAATPALGFLVIVKLFMRHTTITPPPAPDKTDTTSSPTPATPDDSDRETPPGMSTLDKLPGTTRTALMSTTHRAHAEGRAVTPEDLTATISLPEAMAASVVAELNTRVNGHPR